MNTGHIERWLADIHAFMIFMIFFFIALVVAVIIFACLKASLRDKSAARAKEKDRKEKFRPDGTAYPPFGRGFCDNCNGAFDKVYYLPSGMRLCPACYLAFEKD